MCSLFKLLFCTIPRLKFNEEVLRRGGQRTLVKRDVKIYPFITLVSEYKLESWCIFSRIFQRNAFLVTVKIRHSIFMFSGIKECLNGLIYN